MCNTSSNLGNIHKERKFVECGSPFQPGYRKYLMWKSCRIKPVGFGTKSFVNSSSSQRSNLLTQGVGINLILRPATGAPSKFGGGSSLGRKSVKEIVVAEEKVINRSCQAGSIPHSIQISGGSVDPISRKSIRKSPPIRDQPSSVAYLIGPKTRQL